MSEWLSSINQQTSAGKNVDIGEPFLHCWWECRLLQPLWKAVWGYLNKLKMELPFDPAVPLLGIYPKELNTVIGKDISIPMFIAVLFTTSKIWKQPKCSLVDQWVKQLWDIYTMKYYSDVKKKQIVPFVIARMDMENSMLNEISKSETEKYPMISLICGI